MIQKLAYVVRGLTHYRLPVVDELRERNIHCVVYLCGDDGAYLGAITDQSAELEVRDLRRRGPHWRSDVLAALSADAPDAILLEQGASLDFAWTILLSRTPARAPRVLWTHGVENRECFTGKRSLAGWGRWLQIAMSSGVICYDPVRMKSVKREFPGKVVGLAQNSTEGRDIADRRKQLGDIGRREWRMRLGLKRERYIVTLGRLIPVKEFHRVARIAATLRNKNWGVGVVVIGGGTEESRVRQAFTAEGFVSGEDVIYLGPLTHPHKIAEWLYCADLCINPGSLGLSVVDCLFAGIPVASIKPGLTGPYHSPEWIYLEDGRTGWFAESNSDDALASRVIEYLALPEHERAACEEACMSFASAQLGVPQMVDGLLSALEEIHSRRSDREAALGVRR